MDNKGKVLNDFKKMKRIVSHYIRREKWEKALKTIFFASGFMYTLNQILYDSELEDMVEYIAKCNIPRGDFETNERIVLFYDESGAIKRGLARIYLEALHSLNVPVKYVTYLRLKDSGEEAGKLIGKDNLYFIEGNTYLAQMKSLAAIIKDIGAGKVFIYTNPDDVVGIGVFSAYKRKLQRYLINQTDHAFWLGRNASDIIINFREFGYRACEQLRDISEEQLVYLPYYPHKREEKFGGLPFIDKTKKFIFSGGALYKTISTDNKYYKLIETVLRMNEDVNFIYFGNGASRRIRKLRAKFPDRVYWEKERDDFYAIMERCTIYLSTYPYNGGLMTQYALLAGKIPVTLHCNGIERELAIHDEENFWNFDSFEGCVEEIKKLLRDDLYRKEKESKLNYFLIDSHQFAEELKYILNTGKSLRECKKESIEFEGFMREPMDYYTGLKYDRLFYRRGCKFIIWFFPLKYFRGAVEMVVELMNLR